MASTFDSIGNCRAHRLVFHESKITMLTNNSESSKESKLSPRELMEQRHPELFSDSVQVTEPSPVSRSLLLFHLGNITAEKQENQFEQFCTRLACREICPNLIPQTGPSGGGDSKVDSETYPVAKEIAMRWCIGDASASERWAIAISAKQDWRSKCQSDVRKISETERGYSRIYFISSQNVKDKDRSEVAEALSKELSAQVIILDRNWIASKVIENKYWDLITHLDMEVPAEVLRTITGPNDSQRKLEFEEVERQITDQNTAHGRLVAACLDSAILARDLNFPRQQIVDRFNRAERIAQDKGGSGDVFRVLYKHAWTAYWWYNDFLEMERIYELAEPLALSSNWIWDIDKLYYLHQLGRSWKHIAPNEYSDQKWEVRTKRLVEALSRFATEEKTSSGLWARTQLIMLDLLEVSGDAEKLDSVFIRLRQILDQVDGHLEYPLDSIFQIIQELGAYVTESDAYDELIESIIRLDKRRGEQVREGAIRLKRGLQKLEAGLNYQAIDQFAKAQFLFVQEDQKHNFIACVVFAAQAYERAGLLWAARANYIHAIDRAIVEIFKDGHLPPQTLKLIDRVIWVDIQLGLPLSVFAWWELMNVVAEKIGRPPYSPEEQMIMEGALGIVILRTPFAHLEKLGRLHGVLDRLGLSVTAMTSLFAIGQEDRLQSEYPGVAPDTERFFSLWGRQPVADSLPKNSEWHCDNTITLRTKLLGCSLEFNVENNTSSLILAEALLAFLEAFFSTAITFLLSGRFPTTAKLIVEIRPSEYAEHPFGQRIEEDNCGERRIIITHSKLSAVSLAMDDSYQESLLDLIAQILPELQIPSADVLLEPLFAEHKAMDRALYAGQCPISLSNLFGSAKYHIEDWVKYCDAEEDFTLLRSAPWRPNLDHEFELSNDLPETTQSNNQFPQGKFELERLKHSDFSIVTPINFRLWDRAEWRAVALLPASDEQLPELVLMFNNPEATKIFRAWKKQVGDFDQEEFIGINLITGINRQSPSTFRIAIGRSEKYFLEHLAGKRILTNTSRMRDVNHIDKEKLDQFLASYKKTGRYRLLAGLFQPGMPEPLFAYNLAIEKSELKVIPAWQIGDGPLSAVLGGIVDPVIPTDIIDAPFNKRRDLIKSLPDTISPWGGQI